jgi:putative PEP-CTERM system TPR-repeat lipoprotein
VFGLALSALVGCGAPSDAELIVKAKGHLDRQDFKAAIVEFKTALQTNPQSGEARYLLGRTLLAVGDPSSAVLELNKARDLKFDGNVVLPTLAQALLASGQAKKVTDGFEVITLADPNAGAALKATLARAYFDQGMPDRAQIAVSAALQLDPKNLAARLLQIRLMAGRGAFEQALGMTEAMIVDDPRQTEPWVLKGELLWVGKGDAVGGEKALRQALALDPAHVRAHEALIHLLLQKKDIAGFKSQIAALTKALPNRLETRFYRTQLALIDNDLKKAQEGLQQLLKVAPQSVDVLQLAGIIELRSGAMAQAQTHLKQAIQLAPSAGMARLLLAETQLRSGQSSQGLVTLQPLLEGPKPPAAALGLAAQAYLQDGDMAKAEAFYARAAKADPEDPKARIALAITQLAKGNAEAGFAQLESLAAADKTTYADMALIAARVRTNDLDAALRAVDRLQAKVPDTALPYVMRGRILRQRGDSAGARTSLETALSLDAVNFTAVSQLAAMDVAEKKPDDARKRFEALLARDPRSARARLAVVELRQRAGAKPEEIEGLLAAAISESPDEPAPRLLLVEHHLRAHRAKAAVTAAQEAVAAFPDNLLVLDALGRSQLAAGDSMQAIQTFKRIAASHATAPLPHLRLAETYVAAKDYAAAAQSLRKALDIAPKLLEAQQGLVQVLLVRKQVAEALAVAKQVQTQRPRESAGYLMEGEIQARQRSWDPAIAAFRAAFEREHSSDVAVRLHALYTTAGRPTDATRLAASWESDRPRDIGFILYLGGLAMSRKDNPAAEAYFRKVLALRPDHAVALNNVAWLMLQQGKAGATLLAERANRLAPEEPWFMDTLAATLAADKQLPKALEWQRKAVARDPEAPSLRLNFAKLLIASGDRAQARAELQKLVPLGGRFDRQDEVEALLKSL